MSVLKKIFGNIVSLHNHDEERVNDIKRLRIRKLLYQLFCSQLTYKDLITFLFYCQVHKGAQSELEIIASNCQSVPCFWSIFQTMLWISILLFAGRRRRRGGGGGDTAHEPYTLSGWVKNE